MKYILLIFSIALATVQSFANLSQTYSTRVPAENGLTCQQQAQNLAEKIVRILKVTISETPTCFESSFKDNNSSYNLRSINVHYVADQNSVYNNLYNAQYSSDYLDGQPQGENGIYPTYQNCLNDLLNRQVEFTNHTSLEAVSASCNPDKVSSNYVLNIEGFGIPKEKMYSMSISNYSSDLNRFINETAAVINKANASAVVKYENGILYYSKSELFSQSFDLNLLKNEVQCQSQRMAMEKLYSSKESFAHGSSECMQISIGDLKFWSLHEVSVGEKIIISNDQYDHDYYSFDECMTAANDKNSHDFYGRTSFCKLTARPVNGDYQNESYTLVTLSFQ
jgi:hypothetical protein